MADIAEAAGQRSVRGNAPSRPFPAAAEAKLAAIPDPAPDNAGKVLGFDASGNYEARATSPAARQVRFEDLEDHVRDAVDGAAIAASAELRGATLILKDHEDDETPVNLSGLIPDLSPYQPKADAAAGLRYAEPRGVYNYPGGRAGRVMDTGIDLADNADAAFRIVFKDKTFTVNAALWRGLAEIAAGGEDVAVTGNAVSVPAAGDTIYAARRGTRLWFASGTENDPGEVAVSATGHRLEDSANRSKPTAAISASRLLGALSNAGNVHFTVDGSKVKADAPGSGDQQSGLAASDIRDFAETRTADADARQGVVALMDAPAGDSERLDYGDLKNKPARISEADAEAGSSNAFSLWSAARVLQAFVAFFSRDRLFGLLSNRGNVRFSNTASGVQGHVDLPVNTGAEDVLASLSGTPAARSGGVTAGIVVNQRVTIGDATFTVHSIDYLDEHLTVEVDHHAGTKAAFLPLSLGARGDGFRETFARAEFVQGDSETSDHRDTFIWLVSNPMTLGTPITFDLYEAIDAANYVPNAADPGDDGKLLAADGGKGAWKTLLSLVTPLLKPFSVAAGRPIEGGDIADGTIPVTKFAAGARPQRVEGFIATKRLAADLTVAEANIATETIILTTDAATATEDGSHVAIIGNLDGTFAGEPQGAARSGTGTIRLARTRNAATTTLCQLDYGVGSGPGARADQQIAAFDTVEEHDTYTLTFERRAGGDLGAFTANATGTYVAYASLGGTSHDGEIPHGAALPANPDDLDRFQLEADAVWERRSILTPADLGRGNWGYSDGDPVLGSILHRPDAIERVEWISNQAANLPANRQRILVFTRATSDPAPPSVTVAGTRHPLLPVGTPGSTREYRSSAAVPVNPFGTDPEAGIVVRWPANYATTYRLEAGDVVVFVHANWITTPGSWTREQVEEVAGGLFPDWIKLASIARVPANQSPVWTGTAAEYQALAARQKAGIQLFGIV